MAARRCAVLQRGCGHVSCCRKVQERRGHKVPPPKGQWKSGGERHAVQHPDMRQDCAPRVGGRVAFRARHVGRRRRVQDDGQQGPSHQRGKRAAELAHDERRLRLDPLFQAHPDQPRQRQEPAPCVGAGAARHAGCRPERPRERSQSADRQRLHVYDRRLGHGLQDRRPQSATMASSSGSPIRA